MIELLGEYEERRDPLWLEELKKAAWRRWHLVAVLMEGSKRLRLAKDDMETGIGLTGPTAKRSSTGSQGTV